MSIIRNVYRFYRDGFSEMSLTSRKLWLILIVKLAIMFLILKLFFFQGHLSSRFDSEEEKSEYVRNQLTNKFQKDE